jgi:hypothetical protein
MPMQVTEPTEIQFAKVDICRVASLANGSKMGWPSQDMLSLLARYARQVTTICEI